MSTTIIHSVLLFDGTTSHPDATVVFDSSTGKIKSVSTTSGNVQHPEGATVIDGSGHTLLPGLIESHMHCHSMHLPEGASQMDILRTPLRSGVTTVCDMFSPLEYVTPLWKAAAEELKDARQDGKLITMCDLKSCIMAATIKDGWPKPVVLHGHETPEVIANVATWPNLTPEIAADFVKEQKANGAEYIKLMQENCCALAMPTNSLPVASLELQTAVVKAAHAEGLPVVGHALSVDMTEIILNSGADGLTHTFVDQSPPQSIIDLYKKTNAFVIPTLSILTSLTGELQELRDKFADIAVKRGVIDDILAQSMTDVLGFKDAASKIEYAFETLKILKKEGIDILAGTDAAAGLKGSAIGPSLWQELEMYVDRCDFSVAEALHSATALPAKRFGFIDRGEIKESLRADLVLVKGDVTKNLANMWTDEGIVGVWKEGCKAA